MTAFLRLLVIACLTLLTWWQVTTGVYRLGTASLALTAVGAAGALLTAKDIRAGLWLSAFAGMGYLAELEMLAAHSRELLLPLHAWAALAAGASALLLFLHRPPAGKPGLKPKRKEAPYERYPETF